MPPCGVLCLPPLVAVDLVRRGSPLEQRWLQNISLRGKLYFLSSCADHFHLQHHPLVLLSRPLHTAAHVGESWRRIFCHLETMIVNIIRIMLNIILLQLT